MGRACTVFGRRFACKSNFFIGNLGSEQYI
jgi:hypothetical protein